MPDKDTERPDDGQERRDGRPTAGPEKAGPEKAVGERPGERLGEQPVEQRGERPGEQAGERAGAPVRVAKIPRQADGPPEVPAEAGTQTGPRPPDGPGRLGEEHAKRLTAQWRAVQTGFVDDPRDAVAQADELVAKAVGLLVESLDEQRRRLRGEDNAADPDTGIPTEELRLAMREYHTLLDRLLAV
ncbi:hypothetical protein [Kitasatospora sp. NPDC057223]|uniref:hypothetical protein n=1 Tax=Kitasatospora sp. NPDC057223 TaxID=3346055 RepID=UPI00362F7EED